MERSFGIVGLGSILLLLGCSSPAQARPCPVEPSSVASTDAAADASATSQTSTEGAPLNASATGAPTVPPAAATQAAPEPGGSNASPSNASTAESLPELKVKLTGMHIGGGPNDAETKRPFISAIETGFERMRVCYQKAEEPTKGGTFGVDLRIERQGGHPKVQAVRTAMKGEALRLCLEQAFLGLDFGKPAKGATVLSASVYFELSP